MTRRSKAVTEMKSPPPGRGRHATSIRLTDEGLALLKQMSDRLGIPQSNVMEMAIRRLAEQENVQWHT